MEFNCTQDNPPGPFSQTVSIVSFEDTPLGAGFVEPDLDNLSISIPNVGALEINCGPRPVGGVAFEPEVARLDQSATGGTGRDAALWAGIAVAGVIASIAFAGSATWFARRRSAAQGHTNA